MEDPTPTKSGRSARGAQLVTLAFGLPLVALIGVLVVLLVSPGPQSCGGSVPGCGSLRNAGDLPVLIRSAPPLPVRAETGVADEQATHTVSPGERALLVGETTDVWVEAGQCLSVEGGPLWSALAQIDRVSESTGAWHPIDDWGARVQLSEGRCEQPG